MQTPNTPPDDRWQMLAKHSIGEITDKDYADYLTSTGIDEDDPLVLALRRSTDTPEGV